MPAPKSGGESRGIIITLVFFILASIVLGVVAYYGYADQTRLETQRKDADNKLKAAENDRNYWRFLAWQFKEYMGELGTEERQSFAAARDAWDGGGLTGDGKEKNAAIIKKLDEKTNRDWVKEKHSCNNPFSKDVATLKSKLNTTQTELASKSEMEAKATQDKAAEVQNNEKQKVNFAKDLAGSAKKAADDLETFSKDTLQKRQEQIDQLSKEKTDMDVQIAKLNTTIKTLKDEVNHQKEIQNRIVTSKQQQRQAERNDQAKGEIFSIDGDGSTVTLRLNTTSNLPPQQTFTVRGLGRAGEILPEIKGSLMVTNVISDRLVRARISDVRDRNGNPIQRGDKVFSMGWNPNQRQHVAIAGVIDVNATGPEIDLALQNPAEATRRLMDFKRSLESQGLIVDAYLDLKTLKMVGELTLETDFLIIGRPVDASGAVRTGGEVPEAGKETMQSAMQKMQADAISKGVTLIPLRKWLNQTGYQPLRAEH